MPFQIPVADSGTNLINGVAIQDATGTYQAPIFIDSVSFVANSQPLPTPALTPTSTSTLTSRTPPVTGGNGYTVSGNKIFKDGKEVILHDVNWFGVETSNYTVHGLWARNYKDMIIQ